MPSRICSAANPYSSQDGSAPLPVTLLLIFRPSWGWIIAANVILGISQGLTWSTTVIMKLDLAGPSRRGLAMGLNEAASYLGVAGTALATGYIAASYGLRPGPFLLRAACIALGPGLSVFAVKETRHHAKLDAATHLRPHRHPPGPEQPAEFHVDQRP